MGGRKGKEMDGSAKKKIRGKQRTGSERKHIFMEIRGGAEIRQSSREALSVTGNPGRHSYGPQPINATQRSSQYLITA